MIWLCCFLKIMLRTRLLDNNIYFMLLNVARLFLLLSPFIVTPIAEAQNAAFNVSPPTVFAPGVISRAAHEACPAFTPDNQTVYFQRSNTSGSTILVSHRDGNQWTTPEIASFSGKWSDLEPALSPDGSYLIFSSSRPITSDGKPIDGFFNGESHPGHGGNLWRVDRKGNSWGVPYRLPDIINSGTSVFGHSIANNGNLYFMRLDTASRHFRLYRAQWKKGRYQTPEALPFSTGEETDVDPVVDSQERFLIFGSGRKPAQGMDLFIVFHTRNDWGKPMHMGTVINTPGSDAEPRLSPDGKTLYYSSERLIPSHFPRTHQQAIEDNEAAAGWNNGQYNIWEIDLRPWLNRYKKHQ